MIIVPTYMLAIGSGWPNVQCSAIGDGSVYEQIIWQSGDPLPPKADLDIWITAKTTDEVWRLIQANRDTRSSTGGYLVGTYWFHSDQTSKTQQMALVMLGANLPSGIMWKTMSGAFVSMTPTLATQIFGAAVQSDQAIFARAEQHKAAMMASSTPTSYDFSGGWPQTYQEANP